MQAAYIGTMEALSVAPPPKISGAASPSRAAENFGLSWQRAMNTRATKGVLQSNANATNVNGMNAASQNVPAGNGAPSATGQDNAAGSVPKVEAGSAENARQELIGQPAQSSALQPAQKAVVDGNAGVEGRAEAEVEGSSSATLGKPSVLPKERLPGAHRRPSATAREKEKDAVGQPIADAAKKPAAALERKAAVPPLPHPTAHPGVAQASGTQLATVPGGPAKCDGDAATDGPGKSLASAKTASTGMGRERSSVAVNDAAATALEHEKKSEKGQTVAVAVAGESGHQAGMDGLQSASTVPQSVSSGLVGVAVQPLNSAAGSAPSVGAQLHYGVANSAEGAVAGGYPAMTTAPGRLDVGVFDGTHGWLQIRAELGTGGEVKASLTTSAPAYDAVRAAVPEMVRYLQSEAVSLSRIAVHRATETSPTMGQAQGESRENGSTTRDHATQTDAGALQRGSSLAIAGEDVPTSATASTAMDGTAASGAGLGNWVGRSFGTMPWIGMAGGYWGGGSGSWLNVRA